MYTSFILKTSMTQKSNFKELPIYRYCKVTHNQIVTLELVFIVTVELVFISTGVLVSLEYFFMLLFAIDKELNQ